MSASPCRCEADKRHMWKSWQLHFSLCAARIARPWLVPRSSCSARPTIPTSHFARVVKGVDLRSTAGNCAWPRTPQLTGPPSLHSAACMVHPTLPHLTWQTVHHSPRKGSAVCLQTLGRHPGAWRRGATQVVCVQLQSGTEATTASKDPCRTREPRLCCRPTGVPNLASNEFTDNLPFMPK